MNSTVPIPPAPEHSGVISPGAAPRRATPWQRSSYSGSGGANCVELAARRDGRLLLRESDAPRTVLAASPRRVAALLEGVKAGRFDRLLRHRALLRPAACP